jgi:hypothetical protein
MAENRVKWWKDGRYDVARMEQWVEKMSLVVAGDPVSVSEFAGYCGA